LTLKASGLTPTEISTDGTPADGEDGDHLLVESQARVDLSHHQAPGHHHPVAIGEALTVVGVGHLVPVVVRVENQVVASLARADPRVHHPAVETGAMEAGAHTEDGVLHPVESQARVDPSPLLAVEIGEVHPQAVETGVPGAAGPQAVVESLASLTAALERGIKV